jgi:hypothetical protein
MLDNFYAGDQIIRLGKIFRKGLGSGKHSTKRSEILGNLTDCVF